MQRNFWKKFTDKAASAVVLAIFTLIAYAEVYAFVSGGFFETNRLLYGYSFLSILLLTVMSGLTMYFGVNLYFSLYRPEVDRKGTMIFAAEILTLMIGAAIPVILYYARTMESVVFLKTLPYFLAGLAAFLFLILIPLVKKRGILALIAVVVTIGAVCGFSAVSANGEKLSFEAAPVVIDNGEDFSVVWATNVNSIGYLEYTYAGQKYTVYDAEDGKYRADKRVHTVHVPYDHLYGNTYTISSAKVLKNASRYSETGGFVTSKEYRFADKVTGSSLKMLSLTDMHEDVDSAYAVAAARPDFDILLMMGDEINYVNEFEDIIDYIVIPGGNITGGAKPVLFVRGNHETRGKYSSDIKDVLGMKKYYYTTSYGEQNFIVFDGSEETADDDPWSGGIFLSEVYREEELDEMESLPIPLSGYNICLCHIPVYSTGKDTDQYARFAAILKAWQVKLEISGHEHYLEYEKGEDFDTLIGGGPTDDNGYVSCMITIADGAATIEAYNAKGTVTTYGPISLR